MNLLRGVIKVCAIKAPGFNEDKKELLEDIAVLTGGRVVSKEKEDKLESIALEDLGSSSKVRVSKDETLIIQGKGSKDKIIKRIKILDSRINSTDSEYQKEDLRKRLAKLSGGVAVINVGAVTEIELKEKKMRIDDALHATKAAVEEGVVAGGGIALFHAKKQLEILNLPQEQMVGVKILMSALSGPLRQISFNAGIEGSEVVANLQGKDPRVGYNARTNTYEDLFRAGVIDPTKVVRNALESASSISSMILTTEALITDLDEDKDKNFLNPAVIM